MRSIGIGLRLVASFAVLLLVVCAALTFISYRYASHALRENVEEYVASGAENAARIVAEKASYYRHAVESLARRNAVTSMELATQLSYLRKEQAFYGLKDISVVNPDGTAHNLGEKALYVAERAYFKEAMTGKTVFSDLLVDKVDGKLICIAAAPITRDGRIVGVLIGVIDWMEIIKTVTGNKIGRAGNAYMINRQGYMVAHDNLQLVLDKDNMFENVKKNPAFEPIASFQRKLVAGERGVATYTYKDQTKFAGYCPVEGTDWGLAVTAAYEDLFSGLTRLTWAIVIGAVIILVLGGIVTFLVSRTISRPIVQIMNAATSIASGNLSARSEIGNRNDEIGKLHAALIKMLDMLLGKMKEAEDQATRAREETERANRAVLEAEEARKKAEEARRQGMHEAANQLEQVVEHLSSASEELAAQIEESSHGAEEQRSRTGEAATAMEQVNASVMEVARNASDAAHGADNAKERAQDGAMVVENAVKAIFEVRSQTQAMKSSLSELGQRAEGIGRIMSVIDDIADQTNLLALNAAIEAARAGEAGRGFAVVADEVRKLAEKTMQATKEVGQAIKAIQTGTHDNIAAMDTAAQAVENSTAHAEKAGLALKEIVSLIETTSDQVRNIAASSEEQSAASEQIGRSIEEINRISTETAEAMVQSAKAVAELADLAGNLKEVITNMQD